MCRSSCSEYLLDVASKSALCNHCNVPATKTVALYSNLCFQSASHNHEWCTSLAGVSVMLGMGIRSNLGLMGAKVV